MVSFRREKYVPRGGPDGGDGGGGGDVILKAVSTLRVLDKLKGRKVLRAGDGRPGGPSKRHGRRGDQRIVPVPVGTVVWREDGLEEKPHADLDRPGMEVVVARGGKGGRGNARFATAVRRTPRIAERGMRGEEARLRLELRLMAEVGLVGLPNAGKSSLLRALSASRPKVGAYPFTTLEPYLGVVEVGYDTFVVADLPGLIEGAHAGAGLGVEFLRHVGRVSVLVHVVDGTSKEPANDVEIVRREFEAFGEGLVEKRWVTALNKIDLPDAAAGREEAERALGALGVEVLAVSAVRGDGVDALVRRLYEVVSEERAWREREAAEEPVVLRPQPARRKRFDAAKEDGGFRIGGPAPERALEQLGLGSEEAREEMVRRLRRMGAGRVLRRLGAKAGDVVRIGDSVLEWPG